MNQYICPDVTDCLLAGGWKSFVTDVESRLLQYRYFWRVFRIPWKQCGCWGTKKYIITAQLFAADDLLINRTRKACHEQQKGNNKENTSISN